MLRCQGGADPEGKNKRNHHEYPLNHGVLFIISREKPQDLPPGFAHAPSRCGSAVVVKAFAQAHLTVINGPEHRESPAKNGGRGGIRTHVRVAPKPDFESGAFNHSATLPLRDKLPPNPPARQADLARGEWHELAVCLEFGTCADC